MTRLGAMQDWPLRVMRLVDHAEREHGKREVVTAWGDGSITRSCWAEIAHNARRMAQALEAIGIKPGDRVATLAMNHCAHLVAWYGAIGMGGVLHTINPRLFDDQLAYIANHAEDRVLLYDRAFSTIVERMKPQWTTIERYICFEDEFADWIGAYDGDYQWHEGDERDPCGLCYTSGTTGNPKGVLYEHRSAMIHALAEVAPDCFNLSARSVVMPIVPMFHANAWGIPWAAPLVGCKLVLSADYRPEQLCDLFRDEKVSHSAGVPTVWLGMIEHIERTGDDLADLQSVTIGGSAAPRAMVEWFRARGVHVGHAWGMTETSPIGSMGAPPAGWDKMDDQAQIDFICRQGRVPFGIEMRIVDESGAVLPRDGQQSGDLQVRGPWVLRRYFKEQADATDGDNWFDTGDVAALHSDGTMPIAAASATPSKPTAAFSSSIELIHSPPDLITSFDRSVICIVPSLWSAATSPVSNQFSPSVASACSLK